MSSLIDYEDKRHIERIKMDLKNSLNNLMEHDVHGSKRMDEQHLDDSSTKSTSFHMNMNDVFQEPEQISSHSNTTRYDEQDIDYMNEQNDNTLQHEETSLPLTTDHTTAGEQQMNALEYCHQLLEKLRLAVSTLEPELANLAISTRTADYYLKNLPVPSSDQDPLESVTTLFQIGAHLFSSFRPVCSAANVKHTDPIGEELKESSEKKTSEPSEDNGRHLNEDIQASTRSIPIKDGDIAGLSLVLSQVKIIDQVSNLITLEIKEQPQLFWKKRSINCLREKWCPYIQGRSGKQRQYIQIQWSKLPEGSTHLSNILVPPETRVRQLEKRKSQVKVRPTLKDLIIKKECGFDRKSKRVLCPISEADYRQCKNKVKVIMFSLYKTSEEIAETDHSGSSTDNEEADGSVEDELRKLCKLRICLCQLTEKGDLMNMSNFIDTELIEESKGTEPLAIDPSKVTPKYLCECGNEIITVTLNTDTEKNGFVVRLNDTLLDFHQIRGVTKKQIFFNSLPKNKSEENYLNVMISKKSIAETIKQNHDPYDGLDENQLLHMNIPYVQHSDNPHVHKDAKDED